MTILRKLHWVFRTRVVSASSICIIVIDYWSLEAESEYSGAPEDSIGLCCNAQNSFNATIDQRERQAQRLSENRLRVRRAGDKRC